MVCATHKSEGGIVSQLDGLKEELVYLRLWLGIMVVAEIGLFGWLASAPETTTPRLFALGVGGMIGLGMGIYMLHRHIEQRITDIRSL